MPLLYDGGRYTEVLYERRPTLTSNSADAFPVSSPPPPPRRLLRENRLRGGGGGGGGGLKP